jgi:hypothetical protein
MGSETEGGAFDIHFRNKTNVDICRISLVEKNTSDHCKKTVWSYIQRITCMGMTGCMSTTPTAAMETLLGLPPLQLGTDCTVPTILKNQTGEILLFSRWQRKIFQLYWLFMTVCYLWRYLIGNISREIWLSEAEGWFPSDGLKFYSDGHFGLFRLLFEGVYDWYNDLH